MNDDAPATVWEHDTPDLVDHALGRLSRKFGVSVEPGSIRASISERAVLDCLLDGVPVVVKIDTMSYRGKRERDVLRVARTAGLPVPRTVHWERGPPSLLVTEFVPGVGLRNLPCREAWASAGRLLANLHGLPILGA